MKKRGFVAGLCAGAMLLCGISARAVDVTAKKALQAFFLDGKRAWEIGATAYEIGGNNYVRLRDVAASVGFDVTYDAKTNSVHIDPTAPYSGKQDSDPEALWQTFQPAKVSNQSVYVSGKRAEVKAYEICGYNYFKLRDLGTAVGFGVDYDAQEDIVHLSRNPSAAQHESSKSESYASAQEQMPQQGNTGYDSEEDALDAIFKRAAEETAKAQQNLVNQTDSQAEEDAVQAVFKLVNEAREAEGIAPLILDDKLCEAAQIRAKELETLSSHTRPDGRKFSTVLDDNNIVWMTTGENIAAGQDTAEEVMQDWMSGSHRANILNSKFVKIGIAKYQNQQNQEEWVQLFIG